jgi:hypothetical protein
MHLSYMDLHSTRTVNVPDFLLPSSVATGGHTVNQLGRLNSLELLRVHWLAVVTDDHINGEPGRNDEQRIDSLSPKASPMDLGALVSFLATEPEGFLMRPSSLIEPKNPLHRIAHPEFFFIGL